MNNYAELVKTLYSLDMGGSAEQVEALQAKVEELEVQQHGWVKESAPGGWIYALRLRCEAAELDAKRHSRNLLQAENRAVNFRDCLLNQRGLIAENGMSNEQINDVLNEFDLMDKETHHDTNTKGTGSGCERPTH